jgi:hypothetical protein
LSSEPITSPPSIPSLTDRVRAILDRSDRPAIPLPELASAVGVTADGLRHELDPDPRFVLVPPPPFPDLTTLSSAHRATYEAALRRAGVHGAACVALADPDDPGPDPAVGRLLRDSVARLLACSADPALLAAAERLRHALAQALPAPAAPAPAGLTPACPAPGATVGTDPSTTPAPGPRVPGRGPPRGRPPPRRPPRYRGSRQG